MTLLEEQKTGLRNRVLQVIENMTFQNQLHYGNMAQNMVEVLREIKGTNAYHSQGMKSPEMLEVEEYLESKVRKFCKLPYEEREKKYTRITDMVKLFGLNPKKEKDEKKNENGQQSSKSE